jgi:hypothetical protein
MRVRTTSLDAYNYLRDSGELSRRRWEAYDITFAHGPLTSMEAFTHHPLHGDPSYRNNMHSRLNELCQMGLIEEVGIGTCSVTGRKAIKWDVTARKHPLELKKSVSVKPKGMGRFLSALWGKGTEAERRALEDLWHSRSYRPPTSTRIKRHSEPRQLQMKL